MKFNSGDEVIFINSIPEINIPKGLSGSSIRALAERKKVSDWRRFVVVESQNGRMVRTKRYKYCVYDSGKNREQLTDLEKDSGEMINLADNENYKEILDQHRRLLSEWIRETGDATGAEYAVRG